ncbi:MAG: agmatine deiminase family protein [Bacteroidales bacterium]|nr:agmatine deiminase family protein [Bacteroidales bacterium]MDD4673806.1 agmatine deiminase family protein [Bacteroidales bacterium]MDY0348637.1 agmatine deiminase family protein [Tenuifilaceae bacterium]
MLRFCLLVITLVLSTNLFSQDPLPRHMTQAEKLIWNDYLRNYPADRGTAPPAEIPRTPGEWEEMQGVIVTWASYNSNLREIVRYAKQYVTVYIVCSSPSSVQSYLASDGVDSDNIVFISANYNSVWVRDYGPQSIYLNGTNELAFVDWVYNRPRPSDDVIPSVMANELGVPIYQMTQSPNRLVATGGNFMADGFGQGYSSKLILDENYNLTENQIDDIKHNYMGISPYAKMTNLPYDGIHHIDMHMKLLDEETLLVGQYPTGVSDGPQIETNLNYILDNYQTPYGRPYKVVRIPMPPDEYGGYPSNGSNYLTYTNATILNGLVLVPIYGLAQDNEALEIYRDAMPGYQVVGINMRNVISASGAIHCITREIAANDPIFIGHAPHREEVNYSTDGYTIDATIESAQGISSASVYWSTDTTAGFNQVEMQLVDETNYTSTIPSQSVNDTVYYYISATNENSKTITKPLVAPLGLYTFELNATSSFTLTMATRGNGTTTPTNGTHQYDEGTELIISATPTDGWQFDKWEVNDNIYETSDVEITITEDIIATAYFTEVTSTKPLAQSKLALYPNPSSGMIWIKNPATISNATIQIYNGVGDLVQVETFTHGNEIPVNISQLTGGVYLVKVISVQGVWNGRFVKM